MVRKRGIATRAAQRRAAIPAKDISGSAAPVQEKDRLLIIFKNLIEGIDQRLAEDATVAGFEFSAHVHHLDGRHAWIHDPFG